ncbi:40S ribosomal protein S27 [Claviceps lovelessii]|nr:40S ribosomal protein S27 [Claviceps lovelessii]
MGHSAHAHLASLKSAARFRQVFRSSQDTDGKYNLSQSVKMVLAVDLLNPSPAAEAKKHKLKTLVPAPRSFFMDVKCPGCFAITTVFSHAQTVVICQGCTTVLCQPTGGKARLTEGCSFRRK